MEQGTRQVSCPPNYVVADPVNAPLASGYSLSDSRAGAFRARTPHLGEAENAGRRQPDQTDRHLRPAAARPALRAAGAQAGRTLYAEIKKGGHNTYRAPLLVISCN